MSQSSSAWPTAKAEAPNRSYIELDDLELVDLTAASALGTVGLDTDNITSDDWEACQTVGAAVELLSYMGLIAPSATGLGRVFALFEPKIDPRHLRHAETTSIEMHL